MATTEIDMTKVEEFLGQIVGDAGAAVQSLLTWVGDKLGLWKALADGGDVTPEQLAAATNTHPRMIREWLSAQAAGGYVEYDAASKTFSIRPEVIATLVDEDSPALVAGMFQVLVAAYQAKDKLLDAYRTGKGLAWADHHPELFAGTERFFRPGYSANLTQEWIPALDGVEEKLQRGAKVADVGCGHGVSTIIMAKAYPQSRFYGYDYHPASIERARKLAAAEGVADRCTFEVARGSAIPAIDGGYDVVAFFDALHDMSDPDGAARSARDVLASDGTILLVEPAANDALEDNINPVGRVYYGFSSVICTPCSLDEDGPGLGAQAGPARLENLFRDAGYSTWRAATSTPFNIVFEAKV